MRVKGEGQLGEGTEKEKAMKVDVQFVPPALPAVGAVTLTLTPREAYFLLLLVGKVGGGYGGDLSIENDSELTSMPIRQELTDLLYNELTVHCASLERYAR
jgi:hypothetical protein